MIFTLTEFFSRRPLESPSNPTIDAKGNKRKGERGCVCSRSCKGGGTQRVTQAVGCLAEARLGGMASPSLVKQWTKSSTPMANARQSPVSEPRRSPRLSGGGKGVLTATSANKVVKRSPARRSSLLVGGKRSLEARPTPEVEEDELPEEMQFASDSPAMKKARPSDAKRMSRVSFGGVELLRYDKNQKGLTPARRSSTERAGSCEAQWEAKRFLAMLAGLSSSSSSCFLYVAISCARNVSTRARRVAHAADLNFHLRTT